MGLKMRFSHLALASAVLVAFVPCVLAEEKPGGLPPGAKVTSLVVFPAEAVLADRYAYRQVLVTAEDSTRLPAMAEALGDSAVTSRVRGDFLLLDADQPRGFRVNPQRLSGDVNWLTQFRWGFGKRPLLLFFLMCVIFAVLVMLMVPLLKWRQARRLGE